MSLFLNWESEVIRTPAKLATLLFTVSGSIDHGHPDGLLHQCVPWTSALSLPWTSPWPSAAEQPVGTIIALAAAQLPSQPGLWWQHQQGPQTSTWIQETGQSTDVNRFFRNLCVLSFWVQVKQNHRRAAISESRAINAKPLWNHRWPHFSGFFQRSGGYYNYCP